MLTQWENTPSRSGNHHGLPYIRELPDVCLFPASLAAVTIRRGFQPGCCQHWRDMSHTFFTVVEKSAVSSRLKTRTIWHLFWKDVTEVSFKVTKWRPHLPFDNRQLLILSSGKFEGKGFSFRGSYVLNSTVYNKAESLWILQVRLFEALVKRERRGKVLLTAKKTQMGRQSKISSLALRFSSHFQVYFQVPCSVGTS